MCLASASNILVNSLENKLKKKNSKNKDQLENDGTLWLDNLVLGKNDARELEEKERRIN